MKTETIDDIETWGIDTKDFSPQSKVWIYMAEKPFDNLSAHSITQEIHSFCKSWTSHNRDLKAGGALLYERFIVLMVDESNANASGCSIDKSLAFVKYLEQQYHQPLLLRTNIAFRSGNGIEVLPLSGLKNDYKTGRLSNQTIVFDNLVSNWEAFSSRWEVPLQNSWMTRFV